MLNLELSYARFGRLSRTSCSPKVYVSLQNSHDTCTAPHRDVGAPQQHGPLSPVLAPLLDYTLTLLYHTRRLWHHNPKHC